jgi:hypothetical protein
MALWDGYLWSPQINVNLLSDIKPAMTTALAMADSEGELRNLFFLFADILIEIPSAFNQQETKDILASMQPTGLMACAGHFEDKLRESAGNAEVLWRNTIAPIFKESWPVDNPHQTAGTRTALGEMLLETKQAFPDGLKLLTNSSLLGKLNADDRSSIVYELESMVDPGTLTQHEQPFNIVSTFPEETLELIDIVTPETPHTWSISGLQAVLDAIKREKPNLARNRAFIRLLNLLNRG